MRDDADVRDIVHRVYEADAAVGEHVTSMTAICGEMLRVGAIIRGAEPETSDGSVGMWFSFFARSLTPGQIALLDLIHAAPTSDRKRRGMRIVRRRIVRRHGLPPAFVDAVLRGRVGMADKADEAMLAVTYDRSLATIRRWRSLVTRVVRVGLITTYARLDQALIVREGL